ncbi:MAG: GNAT family N-acetyltransferase [Qipengyuania vulgaris]
MATLVPLSAVDSALIEQLLDAAFGEGRHARTAYRIREGTEWLPGLSFAALDEHDYLVGSIQLWPVALTDPKGRPHPLIMVGPVAVMPGRQGEGFGKALMAASLGAIDAAFEDGAPPYPQMLIGDADYYGQWGFTAEHTGRWHCPGPFEPGRLLLRTGNPAILPREGMLGPWTEETSEAAR